VFGEDAGDVECDVARTDDGGRAQVGGQLDRFRLGVAGVPGHEFRRAQRAAEVLAGDVQRPVAEHARGHHHHVVGRAKVVDGDVLTDGDVAEETHLVMLQATRQHAGDVAGLRVIGRDAVADQAVRRRCGLEHVDVVESVTLEQRGQRVQTRRACADHRGAAGDGLRTRRMSGHQR